MKAIGVLVNPSKLLIVCSLLEARLLLPINSVKHVSQQMGLEVDDLYLKSCITDEGNEIHLLCTVVADCYCVHTVLGE